MLNCDNMIGYLLSECPVPCMVVDNLDIACIGISPLLKCIIVLVSVSSPGRRHQRFEKNP